MAQGWFQDNDEWGYKYNDGFTGTYGFTETSIAGDTIINGIDCKILNSRTTAYSQSQRDTIGFSFYEIYFEENRKVFFWDGNEFQMIYDMELVTGDTIWIGADNYSESDPWVLDSVDYIERDGERLLCQYFNLSERAINFYGVSTVKVVEGIGATNGFDFSLNWNNYLLFDIPTNELCDFSRDTFSLSTDITDCYVLPDPIFPEFAPIGATWYYESFQRYDESTVVYTSLRDTIIDGRDCRIINKSQSSHNVPIEGEFIIHQEFGKIYHYIESLDSFNLIFNFLARKGDTWRSIDRGNSLAAYNEREEYITEVNDISFLFVDNNPIPLEVLDVSMYRLFYGEREHVQDYTLIEGIGFMDSFFPGYNDAIATNSKVDRNIRCYVDNENQFAFTDGECFITSTSTPTAFANISVYPNPTTSQISIDYPSHIPEGELQILDLMGRVVLHSSLQQVLDLNHLSKGTYVLKINDLSGADSFTKVIAKY